MSIEANPVCTRDHEESPRLVIRLPPLFPSLALASRVSPPGILGAPSASKSRLSHQSIERRGPRGIVMVWFGMVFFCFVLLPVRQPGRHATRDAPSCSSASILQLLSNLVPISGAGQTRPSHHIVHIRTSSSSPPTPCSPPSLTNTMSCTPPTQTPSKESCQTCSASRASHPPAAHPPSAGSAGPPPACRAPSGASPRPRRTAAQSSGRACAGPGGG